jgi:hypothetical protein
MEVDYYAAPSAEQETALEELSQYSSAELIALLSCSQPMRKYSFDEIFMATMRMSNLLPLLNREAEAMLLWEMLATSPEMTDDRVKQGIAYAFFSDNIRFQIFWRMLPDEKLTDEVIQFLFSFTEITGFEKQVQRVWREYAKAIKAYVSHRPEVEFLPMSWLLSLFVSQPKIVDLFLKWHESCNFLTEANREALHEW